MKQVFVHMLWNHNQILTRRPVLTISTDPRPEKLCSDQVNRKIGFVLMKI
jgi:hypothetical protein